MMQYHKWPTATNFALVGVFSNRQEMEDALMGLSRAGYMPDVVTVIEKELTPVREGPTEPGFNSAYARVTINVPDYQILEKVKWLLERDTHPEVLKELIDHMESEAANG